MMEITPPSEPWINPEAWMMALLRLSCSLTSVGKQEQRNNKEKSTRGEQSNISVAGCLHISVCFAFTVCLPVWRFALQPWTCECNKRLSSSFIRLCLRQSVLFCSFISLLIPSRIHLFALPLSCSFTRSFCDCSFAVGFACPSFHLSFHHLFRSFVSSSFVRMFVSSFSSFACPCLRSILRFFVCLTDWLFVPVCTPSFLWICPLLV